MLALAVSSSVHANPSLSTHVRVYLLSVSAVGAGVEEARNPTLHAIIATVPLWSESCESTPHLMMTFKSGDPQSHQTLACAEERETRLGFKVFKLGG